MFTQMQPCTTNANTSTVSDSHHIGQPKRASKSTRWAEIKLEPNEHAA